MKNHKAKKLSLTTHTVRSLQEQELAGAAGGFVAGTQYSTCPPTYPANACHFRTPNCPQ